MVARREIRLPRTLTIRVDDDILQELELIALFEKARRGTVVRNFLIEKIRTYRRRPEYLRFRKQLDARFLEASR